MSPRPVVAPKNIGRRLMVGGSVFLLVLGLLGAQPALAAPGDEIWADRTGYISAGSNKVLTASDGRVVLVGGADPDGGDYDYLTMVYSSSGKWLWTRRYGWSDDGAANDFDSARDAAFGPTQTRVYVVGSTENATSGTDWGLVAYRADGKRLWARSYDRSGGNDVARSIATSPTTGRIYVTGSSSGTASQDVTTVAYSPKGRRLWVRHHDGRAAGQDAGTKLLVGSNGRRVFVAGSTSQGDGTRDIAVLAYRGDGSRIWTRRYAGDGGSDDTPASAAIGPNGRHLYVVGATGSDFVTLSYRRDGARLWSAVYDGPVDGTDHASDVAVSPDGTTVFVTGRSEGLIDADVATLAYSSFGDQLWVKRYDSGKEDDASTLAVRPDGSRLFVATGHDTITVVAYTSGGAEAWISNESWSGEGADTSDIAVSADGKTVVVSGDVRDVYWQAAVIAYSTV